MRSGFSLIEVLVAMCVLAVGVLGAIATQAATLRTRHETQLMSQAAVVALGLADQMRANPAIFHGADADNPYLQIDFDASAAGPAEGAGACAQAPCEPAAVAQADAAAAVQSIAAAFPGGRIVVCRDARIAGEVPQWSCASASGAPVVIKIGWVGRTVAGRAPAADAALRFVLAVPDVG